ncbi:MAG: hypothetical protein COB85_00125 [Bacteroidetes bacterium]|nr:MAG: hypothetical protein COB85_00125 [Bacteroidota bacterium]
MDKPDKKVIRTEARKLLKEGISRQTAYENLKTKYKNGKIVADLIKNLPSLEAIKLYGKWNYMLLSLLILTAGLYMYASPSIGIVLWYGILIYGVARMLLKYYMWVAAMAAFGLIVSIVGIIFSGTDSLNWAAAVLVVCLNIPSLILPIWLEKRLCPKPSERKEKYTNKQGQQRMKVIYEFKDV